MINLLKKKIFNINDVLKICLEQNVPFVSYCLPNNHALTTLVQYKTFPRVIRNFSDVHEWKGFVIAPFDMKGELPAFILEPDEIITSGHVSEELLRRLKNSASSLASFKVTEIYYSTEKDDFMHQVFSIKKEIDKGLYTKVVLSRIMVEPHVKHIDLALVFEAIRIKYPSAFRYIFNIPGIGCWMGASPEPFILDNENSIEITALAGTQKLNDVPLQDLKWNAKELTEQQYVTQYIADTLHKFNISNYTLKGPFSYAASNVVHLKSVLQLNSESLKYNLGEFIEELYPLPSVAGTPKIKAISFINELEQHNREYYTGFLGPMNIDYQTNLFVNLRCMKLTSAASVLYAGAGITKDSDAELEWEETNQKLHAMQSVLSETSMNRAYFFKNTNAYEQNNMQSRKLS
jgi:isochorismate synthase